MVSYIEYNEFEKVDIRVGTIIEAKENNKNNLIKENKLNEENLNFSEKEATYLAEEIKNLIQDL